MTIIKNTTALANYPFRAISPEVVDLMERMAQKVAKRPHAVTLKLFECYCDLQDVKLTYLSLSTSWYLELAKGFLGALKSTTFVDSEPSSRQSVIRLFGVVHEAMRTEIPAMEKLEFDKQSLVHHELIWEARRTNLNAERIQFWNGWSFESSKGKQHALNLPGMWLSHGKEFTENFHRQWLLFFKKQARPAYTEVNKMAKFLSEHGEDWPAVTFQHPQMIKAFYLAFMKDFFLDAYRMGMNLNAQIKTWGRFISNCEEIFIETGVWATPYQGKLPKPTAKSDMGVGSRKKTREDGVVVHEKLITPVPLYVTDEEAIEIIFHRVETDILIVKSWAIEQCRSLISRSRQRKALARGGKPILSSATLKTVEEIGLDNICATFEQDGFNTSKSYLASRFGSGNFVKVANLLGLPTTDQLYPHQILLVAEHPAITGSFFEKFMLFDDNGDFIGFIKDGSGAKLIGYKDRRGKKRSEQIIELTPSSQKLIEEIIEVTEPLREFLRKEGNPAWKELFLTCGSAFKRPNSADVPSWSPSRFKASPSALETLKGQFAPYEHMLQCGLQQFLERVSLSSLRSSCGVEVYLRTKSVTEMAKALGHAKYGTQLLSLYLPEAILSFFQTRWIRIFQRSFICEAMKNSPYLLDAANFESMDELHMFLKNHALKDIPSHLRNPDNKPSTEQAASSNSHIYISIDVGIMTALLSLEAAVEASSSALQVCGRAKYWAEVSKAVSNEIERGHDNVLKGHLIVAKSHCNPSQMNKVIYVAAA